MFSPEIKKRILYEVPIIIFALVSAVILWYFNQLNYTQEVKFTLVPQLRISEQMIPLKQPKTVNVKVKIARDQLQSLNPDDFTVVADFSNVLTSGEHEGSIRIVRSSAAKYLKGIEVTYSPSILKVTLERKIAKMVKIKVNTTGTVKAGFEVELGIPSPDEIRVIGAKSDMENIEFIETEPIDMEELTKKLNSGIKSLTVDKIIRLMPTQEGTSSLVYNINSEILYSIRIRELIKQISISELYINQLSTNPAFKYKLSHEFATLSLSGPEILLNKLSKNGLVLGVNLDSIDKPGVYSLPVTRIFDTESSNLMKNIIDLGLSPSEIVVTVENQ